MGSRFRTGRGRGYGTAGAGQKSGPGARKVLGHAPKLVKVHAGQAASVQHVAASWTVQALQAAQLAPGALVAGGGRQ